jgi:hypothetical protein
MKNIKILSACLILLAVFLVPQTVLAACDNPASSAEAIQCGTDNASGHSSTDTSSLNGTVKAVINILSLVIGVLAVIMVMVGGLRYVTSGGASDKVKSARDTIIYALIGLAVAALAQVMVHFVLAKTTTATSPQCVSSRWDSGPHVGEACR